MIIIAIISLLIVASLSITFYDLVKPRIALSWTVALIASFLTWVAVFILRLYLPSEFTLPPWQPETIFYSSPLLVINYNNWPYSLALTTLCMGAIFTDSVRSFTRNSPRAWSGTLSITAITVITLLAGDPLTLTFAWTLVDLVELFYSLGNRESADNLHSVSLFGIRLLSVFALIAATIIGWQVKPVFTLSEIPPSSGLFFLIAAGLRLGVLPISLPINKTSRTQNGTDLLLRFAPVASSLMLISNLPSDILINLKAWIILLKTLTTIAVLYASAMWLTRKEIDEARPYWIIALAAFSIMCALNGQPGSSRAWGIALLLSGGILFLFDPPIRRIRFIPMIGVFGLVAFPFTPAASGWYGLLNPSFSVVSLAMILSHAFLTLGYLRYILESNSTVTGLEKHARITYPLGLILIIQSIFMIGIIGWPGVLTKGSLWGSLASFLITGMGFLLYKRLGLHLTVKETPIIFPTFRFLKIVLASLRYFFSLEWVYFIIGWIFHQISLVGTTLAAFVEGEGGILWSLVFLVILITLFLSRISIP